MLWYADASCCMHSQMGLAAAYSTAAYSISNNGFSNSIIWLFLNAEMYNKLSLLVLDID